MAITATEILEVNLSMQSVMAGMFQRNELKRNPTGALESFFASTPSLVAGGASAIAGIRQSSNKVGRIPVFRKTSRTVGSSRSCEGSGTDSTAMVTPTYVLKSAEFFIPVAALGENIAQYEAMYQHHISESMGILHQSLDELCLTYLESNKSEVNAGTINSFSASLDRMEVSLANKTQYFGSILAEMQQNNIMGPYHNVHTLGQQVYEVNAQSAQGINNATNLNWQFAPFQNYGSGNFDIETGTSGGSYIYAPGTVGIIPWARHDFISGNVSGEHIWTTFSDPVYPITWELKIKTGCSDQSSVVAANAGYEAAYGASFVLSAEFATIKSYTSNTDTSIYKYVQKTS